MWVYILKQLSFQGVIMLDSTCTNLGSYDLGVCLLMNMCMGLKAYFTTDSKASSPVLVKF